MTRYVLHTRYVADATRIHIISSLSIAKTYRFCGSKNIEQTEFAYRQKENNMSYSINANVSHAFYYTSASYKNGAAFEKAVRKAFSGAIHYSLTEKTDDPYIADMQNVERFLHGGGQAYRVTRFFLKDIFPDLAQAGFAGWCAVLSYFEEFGIMSVSFHYSLRDTSTDGLIALRQSGIYKKYKFGDDICSCIELAQKVSSALGFSKHVETSFLCEITKFGAYTDISEMETKESGRLYGILSGDEGYAFVPGHILKERLSSSWGSRDFIRLYASRQTFLFVNLLGSPRHAEYLKREEAFGIAANGVCDPYFYVGECPLTVNHGILFSVEFVMMRKVMVTGVLAFQTEHRKKKFTTYYRKISETRELRRKIIKVLEKVEHIEISEIGELSAMLLVSQHIAPTVEHVKYLLELLEADLTLTYSEINNFMVTVLTILGLLFALWEISLSLPLN